MNTKAKKGLRLFKLKMQRPQKGKGREANKKKHNRRVKHSYDMHALRRSVDRYKFLNINVDDLDQMVVNIREGFNSYMINDQKQGRSQWVTRFKGFWISCILNRAVETKVVTHNNRVITDIHGRPMMNDVVIWSIVTLLPPDKKNLGSQKRLEENKAWLQNNRVIEIYC
jgi:hypothetical protein